MMVLLKVDAEKSMSKYYFWYEELNPDRDEILCLAFLRSKPRRLMQYEIN